MINKSRALFLARIAIAALNSQVILADAEQADNTSLPIEEPTSTTMEIRMPYVSESSDDDIEYNIDRQHIGPKTVKPWYRQNETKY